LGILPEITGTSKIMEIEKVLKSRLLPAVVLDNAEQALPLAEALLKGGLNVIEITLRTPAALAGIRLVKQRFPEMVLGAGTLLTADQVAASVDAGAIFGVAPGLDSDVVAAAQRQGMALIPGVMTPTEICQALKMNCKVLKFFPAATAGGVKMLGALAGPFAHAGVKFVPTGGIHAQNMCEYLALPEVTAVGGSWMVTKALVSQGKWSEIETLTREACKLALSAR
jgi:2-dehydro-3-deoxyphosphogluconate aldolase/(4S)-4-hydroxy-2-oxoglutarate aldolase